MTHRASLALLVAAVCLTGCGSEFVDPILQAPTLPSCPTEAIADLDGGIFATIPRVIDADFTIEAWIATNATPTGGKFSAGSALVFADVEAIAANDFALGLLNDRFFVNIGLPDTTLTSGSTVATGNWTHVAATRAQASGQVLLYVNGIVEASAEANTSSLSDSSQMTIAGRPGRNYYTGRLSELRIWNVARTPDEISGTMNQRLIGDEPGLVGYFPFDEGDGSVAHDASPSGNDASFDGPLQWVETDPPFCGE